MRAGHLFKRCRRCGRKVTERRCSCGSDSISWAFVVDLAASGEARKQVARSGFATKGAARAAMTELQTSKAAGTYIEVSEQSVDAYLEQWLAGVRGQVRGGTFASYQLNVRRLRPLIGSIPLQQLTRNQVKAAYQTLREGGRLSAGTDSRGAGLSAKTVHNVHLTLRKALGDAVEGRLLTFNPANASHKLPRNSSPEMLSWSGEELRTFLAETAESPNHALWRLAGYTGMRRGEILGLRWRDLDLEASRLSVRQQLVRAGAEVTFGPPKTKQGSRPIALDAGTVLILRSHRAKQTKERLLVGSGYHDGDLVFARADGSPLDPDVVTGQFEAQIRRLKMRRIRFHDLRHTHATLALRAGIHPKVVQERLGHSSVVVTLDLYSHAVLGMQEDAAARIAAVVDGLA